MGVTNMDEHLFEAEQQALQTALTDVADERYLGNELLSRYKSMTVHYYKLLRTTKKIFRISDSQGKVLQQHRNEIQNLLDNTDQGFLSFGRDLKVNQYYSSECTRIFGRKLAGLTIVELLRQGQDSCAESVAQKLQQTFCVPEEEGKSLLRQLSDVVKIADRDIRIEYKRIHQPDNTAECSSIMMVMTDITDKVRADEQIRYLSFHDKMTALYNRAYIEMIFQDFSQAENLPVSIIMLDMNGLKLVNDVFGHEQGDLLLIAMAKALTQSCRSTDIISRWGGDEFLVLLPNTDNNECLKICEQIRMTCNSEASNPIPLSAAIGTATETKGAACFSDLFSVAEQRMYSDKLSGNRKVRQNIIDSLEAMLHKHCVEIAGHGNRVKRLASEFAADLGFKPDDPELRPLNLLAALHDIGKVVIPKSILDKDGPLTQNEWEIVRSHSDIGYRMALSIGDPVLAELILNVHERWDGTGYPCGLKGDQIPLLARLFSIVDVYDVITHDRPYKRAMSAHEALKEIEAGSGKQFDPELTAKFLKFWQVQN